MKRPIFLLLFISFLAGCGPSDDEKAMKYIDAATVSLKEGNFSIAKLQLDSIKTEYPKAFETRKKGIRLMLDIEKSEQIKNLQFIDSVLTSRNELLEKLQKENKYKFEKNEEYQNYGTYCTNTQTIEKNYNRSYLRFSVDETGKMTMTSFYYGGHPIKHNIVKITSNNGTFAETPEANNLYSSTNLGMITERQDFVLGKDDGNMIDFIVTNRDTPLRVEYIGKTNYKYRLSDVDIAAAVKIEELARVLSSINEYTELKNEGTRKLNFLNDKIKEYDSKEKSAK